ncbi:MAG: ATP phosphoribosyltransferase regulatory subunit, partial [Pseudomonadota bacterium]
GESVRPRLCIFPGPFGKEMALRADYTLPIAKIEAARRVEDASGDKTYTYDGPVFRLPKDRSEAVEFRQIGFERFGFEPAIAIDRAGLSTLLTSVISTGLSGLTVRMGDLAVVPAFIDALDLPPETSSALKRAFRQAGGITALLDKAGSDTGSHLSRHLSSMSEDEAHALLVETMRVSGISAIGTRGLDEVVERLIAQGQGAAIADISEGARAVLRDVIAVDVAAAEASDTLHGLTQKHGLTVPDSILGAMAERLSDLPDDIYAQFTSTFGRQFTYYDGFVFDINSSDICVGGGGRYDDLVAHLTEGEVMAPAIGGALRMDRIEAALETGS